MKPKTKLFDLMKLHKIDLRELADAFHKEHMPGKTATGVWHYLYDRLSGKFTIPYDEYMFLKAYLKERLPADTNWAELGSVERVKLHLSSAPVNPVEAVPLPSPAPKENPTT